MGIQIEIYQSGADIEEFARWIAQKHHVLCLPRVFSSNKLTPCKVGECNAPEQTIFLEKTIRDLEALISPCQWSRGNFCLRPSRTDGLVIEWILTPRPQERILRVPPGTRFYFRDSSFVPTSKELKSVFNSIKRFIIKNSPMRTPGRIPRYLARDLSQKYEANLVSILYAGFRKMEFEANPNYVP